MTTAREQEATIIKKAIIELLYQKDLQRLEDTRRNQRSKQNKNEYYPPMFVTTSITRMESWYGKTIDLVTNNDPSQLRDLHKTLLDLEQLKDNSSIYKYGFSETKEPIQVAVEFLRILPEDNNAYSQMLVSAAKQLLKDLSNPQINIDKRRQLLLELSNNGGIINPSTKILLLKVASESKDTALISDEMADHALIERMLYQKAFSICNASEKFDKLGSRTKNDIVEGLLYATFMNTELRNNTTIPFEISGDNIPSFLPEHRSHSTIFSGVDYLPKETQREFLELFCDNVQSNADGKLTGTYSRQKMEELKELFIQENGIEPRQPQRPLSAMTVATATTREAIALPSRSEQGARKNSPKKSF